MLQNQLLTQSEKHLNKPNFLINIERPKSLVSNKIYNHFLKIVLTEYDFSDKNGNQDNIFYTTIQDIKEQCKLSKKSSNYAFIYDNIRVLKNQNIKVVEYYDKTDKLDAPKIKKLSEMNLISGFTSFVEDGFISFEIPNILLDHLKQLKEQRQLIYTQLNKQFLNSFKHSYTYILYELLSEYRKAFKLKKSFTDLRQLLNLNDKYTRQRDFKLVIEKSMSEIENITDLKFNYEITKTKIDGKFEYFLLVNFQKISTLTFDIFKKAFLHASKSVDVEMKSKYHKSGLTINNRGYIVEINNNRLIDSEDAIKVWQSLFKTYQKSPQPILDLLAIDEEEEFNKIIEFMRGW